MRLKNIVRTVTGKDINLDNPLPSDFSIIDIAHGLSTEVRFSGQLSTPYTVAEHSIHVAGDAVNVAATMREEVTPKFALKCLLHDASEAYLKDIPAPLKIRLPEYLEIEQKWMTAIFTQFSLDPFTPTEYEIMKSVDRAQWDHELNFKAKYAIGSEAKLAFLMKYTDLITAG